MKTIHKTEKDENAFNIAISSLNMNIRNVLMRLDGSTKKNINEIRLRCNKPVTLQSAGKTFFISSDGHICENSNQKLLVASPSDITSSFHNMCNHSVYSKQNEIKNGFVTVTGGHRIGVCGTAIINDRKMTGLKDICGLNVRVAREMIGVASELLSNLKDEVGGILIAGPPACGKTTLLRDIARQLSYKKKVSVIDERGELGAKIGAISQNDLGLSDILTGYPKGIGILQAIRSLSPDIIICDEVGSQEETYAIEEGLNAGVNIIASIHCFSVNDLKRRLQMKRLSSTGAFDKVVLMSNSNSPGVIKGIYKIGDVIG